MAKPVKAIAMILAGGQGVRLHPLTAVRSKPAVPFGGKYRIVDFVLNNFVNSGIYSMYVLTQFRAQSLTEHIQRYWRFGTFLDDHYLILVPAQMYKYEELGAAWYRGTADAVYQNLHLVQQSHADVIAVFGGDHIFKMNIRHMVRHHIDQEADLTVAAYPVPREQATRFGVIQVDENWRMIEWQEKPADPKPIPGRPDQALASMGNYIFKTDVLTSLLTDDARDENSSHDFGRDIIAKALDQGLRIAVYDFHRNPIPGQEGENTYWRDVGTLEAYHEASMDLVAVSPEFDLYNPQWPLRSANLFSPPSKFVFDDEGRRGGAFDSMLAGDVIVSGGEARRSILSHGVRIHSYAEVERTVLLDNVEVGRHTRIQRAIIDKNVHVPPKTEIGFDRDADIARGFTVTPSGVTVVPKNYEFPT